MSISLRIPNNDYFNFKNTVIQRKYFYNNTESFILALLQR